MVVFAVRPHMDSVRTAHGGFSAGVKSMGKAKMVDGLLVDFDGTACPQDVTGELCLRFARGDWERYDEAARDGEITLRQAIDRQTRMLRASREEMLAFCLASFTVDPDFVALTGWASHAEVAIGVVSDGFGFFIKPMLKAVGLTGLPVYANDIGHDRDGWRLEHPHGHARCRGCGTCKKAIVLRHRARFGSVAFVGDGESDRFAVYYADFAFAKRRLREICVRDRIAHSEWSTFGDVRARLAQGQAPPHYDPAVCPGWTT